MVSSAVSPPSTLRRKAPPFPLRREASNTTPHQAPRPPQQAASNTTLYRQADLSNTFNPQAYYDNSLNTVVCVPFAGYPDPCVLGPHVDPYGAGPSRPSNSFHPYGLCPPPSYDYNPPPSYDYNPDYEAYDPNSVPVDPSNSLPTFLLSTTLHNPIIIVFLMILEQGLQPLSQPSSYPASPNSTLWILK
ncbi:hypothetical protein CCACVL1_12921 [Corchorus capsularis]|uniref:Uncharacterized protein n=1 Tax=Corchorus capsularis TaxID=210143 RepID=A0A1R3ID99_COCAP|nr:hypothetical protein CCACVL1_12921 [Corchorus capsularis]